MGIESTATGLAAGVAVNALLGIRGYRRRSLDASGALAAFGVGLMTWVSGMRFFTPMLAFYISSSALTKYKRDLKESSDAGAAAEKHGRNYVQVLSCSVIGCGIALAHRFWLGTVLDVELQYQIKAILLSSYIGHYATCNGDTWASELGVTSKGEPVLVTSVLALRPRRVPRGTNGGMSRLGTLASVAGGAFIGLVFSMHDRFRTALPFIFIGASTGFLGSLVDSLLGATLQATWYDEDLKRIVGREHKAKKGVKLICGADVFTNEQINLVSVTITTAISAFFWPLAAY